MIDQLNVKSRPKYLIHTFPFLYNLFKSEKNDEFEFIFEPNFELTNTKHLSARKYIPKSWWALQKKYWTGQIKKFDVVHLNRPESYIAFKPYAHQVSIIEHHGFDIGVLASNHFTKKTTPWKQIIARILDAFFSPIFKQKIKQVDIFYVSTPVLIDPIAKWAERTPTWLPNPVDTVTFHPNVTPKKLEGDPVCFLAARLHSDKAPEVAINIFENHILPNYPDAVLHLLEIGEFVKKYKKKFHGNKHFIWHKFMKPSELASVMCGSDFIFGDFEQKTLSLLPMQAMLCKKPVITWDEYEILKEIKPEDFAKTTMRLLSDTEFRNEFIERNYNYVIKKHSPKAIAEEHFQRVNEILKNKDK